MRCDFLFPALFHCFQAFFREMRLKQNVPMQKVKQHCYETKKTRLKVIASYQQGIPVPEPGPVNATLQICN